ncbi:MAG: acyl phosphate:glycerol-3-phosphate acyltransferase [Verrucomicrobiota bacterium]
MWFLTLAVCCLGYLFGSFPAGYFAGRIAGVDVRSTGSGNIGATNVLRVLGKRWGYAVFFVDAFKGLAAVRIAFFLAEHLSSARSHAVYFAILAAVMCVVGHTFPVWLRFKGGKGVATSAGAVFGLMPLAAVIIFLVWVVVFEITRYVSVASLVAASALPVAVALLLHWEIIEGVGLLYFSTTLAILVVWSHRSNFSRLLKGTEQRFTRK